jgi:hypothetical protein
MRREERGELVAYRFERLPATVDVLVSTRHGGVSPSPHDSLNVGLWTADESERVIENRRRLLTGFDLPFERSVWCRQVHSDGVVVIGEADAGRGSVDESSVVPDADAMVTATPGLPLCVKVADCVPVVVVDPVLGVLGLAHAGWGGTVARICSATVATMGERFGSDPAQLAAAIGPSIGPGGYEVGTDVIERARAAYGGRSAEILTMRGEKALFDLWAANRIDLEEAGLASGRIEVGGIASDERIEDFFSHRREDGRTGRFAMVAALRT